MLTSSQLNDEISVCTVAAVIREQTHQLHKQLEHEMGFPASFQSLPAYRRVLRIFEHFLMVSAEHGDTYAAQLPQDLLAERGHQQRLLHNDMQALQMSAATEHHIRLELNTLSEYVGCLYVREGSTLGGRFIRQYMLKKFGAAAAAYTSYLEPYGNECEDKWAQFKRILQREIEQGALVQAEVLQGVLATYDCLLSLAATTGVEERGASVTAGHV